MRQIADGLRQFLHFCPFHLIQQQRKQNGKRKAEEDGIQADQNCIHKNPGKLGGAEQSPEMLQPHKRTIQKAAENIKILKGHYQPAHWQIAEYKKINQTR